jgi:excinuclease ABC subunit C
MDDLDARAEPRAAVRRLPLEPGVYRFRDGGQEVEVWIGLHESARSPGLTVSHQPAPGIRNFGPYLGGRQVRLAVSGLNRVLPLGYAGDLDGTRGDLARVRGVTAADRAQLAERVAAVLDRVPEPVASARAALCARRGSSASRSATAT